MIDLSSRRVQSLNDRRNVLIAGDFSECLTYCVKHFISLSEAAIKKNGVFSVALSGGSTPKAIFQALCTSPYKEKIQWGKIFLFWSDERSVPPTDPESNYKMAMDAGFKDMPFKKEHIFRMSAEKNIQENAKKYESTIQKALKKKPLDMVMLGMGEDGHTASLFPKTEGLKEQEKLVIANYIPQKKTWRMTLTFKGINQSRNIVFYVLGEKKQDILKKILFPEDGSPTYPSQLVGTAENKALWIVDVAAAKKLKNLPAQG